MRHDKKGDLEITKYAKPKERYYGIEIEHERRTGADAFIMLTEVIPVLKEIGFVCGTDYSIQDGLEFRSCPQTFSVLRANLKKFYDTVKPYFKSTENCGVHIHVSRSSLSNYQIGKLIGFVYNRKNAAQIEDVSRRPSGRWQEFDSGSSFIEDERLDMSSLDNQPRLRLNKRKIVRPPRAKTIKFSNHNKYTAINTGLDHTVEFRLFAGCDFFTGTMAYLEFVDSLCKYTETGKVDYSLRDLLKFDSYKKWLTSKGKRYKHIQAYLGVAISSKNKYVKPSTRADGDTSNFDYKNWELKKIKQGKLQTTNN